MFNQLSEKGFFAIDTEDLLSSYKQDPASLEREGFQKALELFHEAAERIPAYKDFLRVHDIDHTRIRTREAFRKVPVTTKKNYITRYPLHELCWDGTLDDSYIVASSSGSTGEPFLWPRGEEQEHAGSVSYEVILKHIFEVDKYRTLFVINYAMGTWIAGPFALARAVLVSRKGNRLTTVTPGTDIDVSLALIKKLGPLFDQIIIAGYPPLVKDLLDKGSEQGLNWKQQRIRFLLSAEGFSEQFRDYIHEMVGAEDPLTASVNIYASADAGTHAHETPLSVRIRRQVSGDPSNLEQLFGDSRVPTLAQYDPRVKYLEILDDNSLIFTARAGIPLIRYSIGDTGRLYSFETMRKKLAGFGYDIEALLDEGHEHFLWKLPFVCVFGRKDFTASLHGALIYPEHIKYGLERSGLEREISGRFVMSTEYTETQDPYLLIRVELAADRKPHIELQEKLQAVIAAGLKEVNSEYVKLSTVLQDRALPVIKLIEYGDERYFKRAGKQRWTAKK